MGRWRQLVLNAKKQTDYTVTNYPNTPQVGKVCLSREGSQGEEGGGRGSVDVFGNCC